MFLTCFLQIKLKKISFQQKMLSNKSALIVVLLTSKNFNKNIFVFIYAHKIKSNVNMKKRNLCVNCFNKTNNTNRQFFL